jgi:hypothetical protein
MPGNVNSTECSLKSPSTYGRREGEFGAKRQTGRSHVHTDRDIAIGIHRGRRLLLRLK